MNITNDGFIFHIGYWEVKYCYDLRKTFFSANLALMPTEKASPAKWIVSIEGVDLLNKEVPAVAIEYLPEQEDELHVRTPILPFAATNTWETPNLFSLRFKIGGMESDNLIAKAILIIQEFERIIQGDNRQYRMQKLKNEVVAPNADHCLFRFLKNGEAKLKVRYQKQVDLLIPGYFKY